MEQNHKKRKRVMAMIAVLSISILMTGTYAWQSISQKRINERVAESYPGGRVHDDFDGYNKDVYAENYSDEGGVPVYVRIRLDEYMEVGDDAGDFEYDDNGALKERTAKSLVENAKADDTSTWRTRTPDQSDNPFARYWNWMFGGFTVYMPTFDKNKDSLSVDGNGSYQGDGTGVPYNDYYAWTLDEPTTKNAYYDADDNTIDEGEDGEEGVNYTVKEETHYAANTKTAEVMSMDAWVKAGSPVGNYWVWDDDGWFYWARPLRSQQTTGLLLDEIVQIDYPDAKCYYAINVVGQFATDGDFGDKEKETGFYKDGATISEKAEKLLGIVTSVVEGKDGKEYVDCGYNTYKELKEDGTYGTLVCAGANGLIGDSDDIKDNIIVLKEDLIFNGTNYGHLFLCPENGSYKYQSMNMNGDKKLGTGDDVSIYYTGSIADFPDEGKGTLSEMGATKVILTANSTSSSAGHTAKIDGTTITVQPNDIVNFTTNVMLNDTVITNQNVKWNISQIGDSAITFDKNEKKLTVGATSQVGTTFTLQAVSEEDTRVTSDIYTIVVEGPKTVAIAQGGKEVTTAEVAKSKTSQTTTAQFTATVKAADGTTYVNNEVTWSLKGAGASETTISQSGELTVAIAEDPENVLKITATSKADPSLSKTINVTLKSIFDGMTEGSTSTVMIDGTKFYMLAKDRSKAKTQYLLFATDPVANSLFGSTLQWTKLSTAYKTLDIWLNNGSHATLAAKAQETKLHTRTDSDAYGSFNTDTYKIFMLSEADLNGTQNKLEVTDSREYTYPAKGQLTSDKTIIGFTDKTNGVMYDADYWYWFRSPYGNGGVAVMNSDGSFLGHVPSNYETKILGLRPALWVNGL